MSLRILPAVLSVVAVCSGYTQSPGQNRGEISQQSGSVSKVPSGVILVKGAWASASDTTTPVPEGGQITNNVYNNPYFRLTYPLFRDWISKYDGPPPSDSGYYVLAQVQPRDTLHGVIRGSLMVTAVDLFFTPTGASSALQFVNFSRKNLQPDYQVTRAPRSFTLTGHSFIRFDYFSPVAGLHWYVLATQIRCHSVQFTFSSRDLRLLEDVVQDLARVKLPDEAGSTEGTGGGEVPVCIKDYAKPDNIVQRVDPILTGHRFNPIPVRVIIDKEGMIRHVHILSAFPEQSQAVIDALRQWRFKPYRRDGQRMEVETGIMFGYSPDATAAPERVTASAFP